MSCKLDVKTTSNLDGVEVNTNERLVALIELFTIERVLGLPCKSLRQLGRQTAAKYQYRQIAKVKYTTL